MNRGVNKQTIFTDDQDRYYFLKRLTEYRDTHRGKIYHWALMGHHFHLLIEIAFDALRPFMSCIQQRYAMYHHSRHGTSGTFWQGRFKSKPVQDGAYMISCGRYIERNPVRAALVDDACQYQWSSARSYVQGVDDRITDCNPHLGDFEPVHRQMYAAALASGIDDAIIDSTSRLKAVGTHQFAARLKNEHGRHRRKRGRPDGWPAGIKS